MILVLLVLTLVVGTASGPTKESKESKESKEYEYDVSMTIGSETNDKTNNDVGVYIIGQTGILWLHTEVERYSIESIQF